MNLDFVRCLFGGRPYTIHPTEVLLRTDGDREAAAFRALNELLIDLGGGRVDQDALAEAEALVDLGEGLDASDALPRLLEVDLRKLVPDGVDTEDITRGLVEFVATRGPGGAAELSSGEDRAVIFFNRYLFLGAGSGGSDDLDRPDPCCSEAAPGAAVPKASQPIRLNPWYAEPWYAEPWYAEAIGRYIWLVTHPGERPPWATNAKPWHPLSEMSASDDGPQVWVLDTALPVEALMPDLLKSGVHGPRDEAADVFPKDGYVDPVAGHSAFIAGIYRLIAPQARIRVSKVVGTVGEVKESAVVSSLVKLWLEAGRDVSKTVINLSFGSPDKPTEMATRPLLDALATGGAAIVSSAGNEGSCVRTYPASFDSVFAVGALDQQGQPAEFSNYGSWVNSWAPGVDIHSAFPKWVPFSPEIPSIDGQVIDDSFVPPNPGGEDPVDDSKPRRFDNGTALWSGTSFSAPIFGGLVIDELTKGGYDTARKAAEVLAPEREEEDACKVEAVFGSESLPPGLRGVPLDEQPSEWQG